MDRYGMQRRGRPGQKRRGAFLLLVACAIASQGVGDIGVAADEEVGSQDTLGGGQTSIRRLTAVAGGGAGGGDDVATAVNAESVVHDDAAKEEEDGGKGLVAPEPSQAVQVNGVQDMELEGLKEEVHKLPSDVLDELPPELWGSRELKDYKRAEKNIRKGQTALDVAAGIAGAGLLSLGHAARGGRGSFVFTMGLLLTAEVVAASVAAGGAIQRRIGRRQRDKVKQLLRRKKEKMDFRAKLLPMLNPEDAEQQPQEAE